MSETGSVIPNTAIEALEQWDAGELVPAFRVESQGASQEAIWGAALEILRKIELPQAADAIERDERLSDREHEVAFSIAHVARKLGWRQMLLQHIGPGIPAIVVQKAK